jgi:hypothetical protein
VLLEIGTFGSGQMFIPATERHFRALNRQSIEQISLDSARILGCSHPTVIQITVITGMVRRLFPAKAYKGGEKEASHGDSHHRYRSR